MPAKKAQYCPLCGIVVAPGDPEQVKKDNVVFHGGCWKARKKKESSVLAAPPSTTATSFRFVN